MKKLIKIGNAGPEYSHIDEKLVRYLEITYLPTGFFKITVSCENDSITLALTPSYGKISMLVSIQNPNDNSNNGDF